MKYIIFRYCITNMNIYKYCLNFAIETVNEMKHFFNMVFSEVRYKLYLRKHLNKPVYLKHTTETITETITEKLEIKCESNDYNIPSTHIENKFDDLESGYESDGLSYGHESEVTGDESEVTGDESEVTGDEVISDLNCKKRVYESDENSVMSTDEMAENIYQHNIHYKNCISELKNIKKIRFE